MTSRGYGDDGHEGSTGSEPQPGQAEPAARRAEPEPGSAEHAAGPSGPPGAEPEAGREQAAERTAPGNRPEPPGTAPAGAEPELAEAVSDRSSGRFGKPGRPFARSPFTIGLTAGLGLVLAYLSYEAIRSIWSILVLIIISGFLAIGLNPAVVRVQSFGLSRGLSVMVVALIGLLLGCGGLFAVIPPVVNETGDLVEAVPGYLEDLRASRWLTDINTRYDLLARAQEALTAENINTGMQQVLNVATVIFGQLFNLLTILILTLYFLVAFDRLKEGAYRLIPASRRGRARLLGDTILLKVGGYMVGSLVIATLAGLASLAFMLITGIPYPFALALVVAICDLIPQIGATLGAIVLSLVGLTVSVWVAVAALIFFILYQQLENWVIYPRVMRRTTQVSDLAAILGVLIGASLLGVVGVLIAIPATAAIQLIVREVVLPRQNQS